VVRGKLTSASLLALSAAIVVALVVVPAAGAAARFPCKPSVPDYPTDADGAVVVSSPLSALPAPEPDGPLYPRVNGRIPVGFSETAFDDPASCTATPETSARYSKTVGATFVRTAMFWPIVQPDGPEDSNWGHFDQVYEAYVAQGIRPLWILLHSPRWAAADPLTCKRDGFCNIGPSRARMRDFGRFAGAVARRYPLSAGIEVWNEPNMKHAWGARSLSGPDPAAYAEMLVAAREAVENPSLGNPAMRLIGGALCGGCVDSLDGSVLSATTFVNRMYLWLKLRGRLDVFDAFSGHAYPVDTGDGGLGSAFRISLQRLIQGFADQGIPLPRLLITEIGAGTGPSSDVSARMTPEQQKAVLLADYRALDDPGSGIAAAGRWDAVMFHEPVESYRSALLEIPRTGGLGWLYQQNVLGTHTPKPVFCAFARLLTGSSRCEPIPAAG